MSEYRRLWIGGGTYFFTVVTHERRPIFAEDDARAALRAAIAGVRARFPTEIVAIVLLPDHLHTVWTLPPGDARFAMRWGRIKGEFSRSVAARSREGKSSDSRAAWKERAIRQRRFWEHACRDEADLKRCVDYIHWNPVKHGLVHQVRDYPWSSFHRHVRAGESDVSWGGSEPAPSCVGEGWE